MSEEVAIRGVELPHPHPGPRAREPGGQHRCTAAAPHLRDDGAICRVQQRQNLLAKDLWQLVQQPFKQRVRLQTGRREAAIRRTRTRTRAGPSVMARPCASVHAAQSVERCAASAGALCYYKTT